MFKNVIFTNSNASGYIKDNRLYLDGDDENYIYTVSSSGALYDKSGYKEGHIDDTGKVFDINGKLIGYTEDLNLYWASYDIRKIHYSTSNKEAFLKNNKIYNTYTDCLRGINELYVVASDRTLFKDGYRVGILTKSKTILLDKDFTVVGNTLGDIEEYFSKTGNSKSPNVQKGDSAKPKEVNKNTKVKPKVKESTNDIRYTIKDKEEDKVTTEKDMASKELVFSKIDVDKPILESDEESSIKWELITLVSVFVGILFIDRLLLYFITEDLGDIKLSYYIQDSNFMGSFVPLVIASVVCTVLAVKSQLSENSLESKGFYVVLKENILRYLLVCIVVYMIYCISYNIYFSITVE